MKEEKMEFKYVKLETYIPESNLKDLQKALQEADAGHQPDSAAAFGEMMEIRDMITMSVMEA